MKKREFFNKLIHRISLGTLILSMILAGACASAPKQEQGIGIRKLAIGITTKDPYYQNLALSNMTNVANHLPGTVQIEIVVWGPALPMLM